jgi:hypothetical protein
MNISIPPISIGWLIALLVLVVCLVFAISDVDLTREWILGLIAALAVARLT